MGKLTEQQIANQPNKYEKKFTEVDKVQSTFKDSIKFNYENAWDESKFTIGKIQQIMKDWNVDAIGARNLLLHELNTGTQVTGKLANPDEVYTPQSKKLYAEWIKNKVVDLTNSPVQKAYEDYKKQIKIETGVDVLFDTKYDKDGYLQVSRPLTPLPKEQGFFGDAIDWVFGGFYDNKDDLYDKKLTKEAVWRADWEKGQKNFDPNDIESIYKYAEKNPKFKESLEVERARLHNIHIKDINALWEKDVDEGVDAMTARALAKGMDDLMIFRPLAKLMLGDKYVGLKDITQADQIEILNDKDGVYGQINKTFKGSKGFIEETKDASMWEKGYKFGISQLPMTAAMMVGSTLVGSAVKGLNTLAMMDIANANKVQKVIKPVADFVTKGNNLNPVKLMLNYEKGSLATTKAMSLAQKSAQWGLKGIAAFEKSVIGLGSQTGMDKLINPEKREKDPNISWWQEGLRDLVDAGLEGVTEELVLFDNLKMAGRGKTSVLVNLLISPIKNAIGENIEEAISGIANDAFDLWYKGKWGSQSIVSQIAKNDYSQIYTTIGTSISAILMGGAFGFETKRREMQFYKNFGLNAKEIIEKWVNIKDIGNQILSNLNSNLSSQERIALTQAMDEGKVLFAAYETGKNAKLTPEEQTELDTKYGDDIFTKNLVAGMKLLSNESNRLGEIFTEEVIKDISTQVKQSMVDNNLEISEAIDKFIIAHEGLNLTEEKKAELKQTIIENAIFNTKFDYSEQQTFKLLETIFKDDTDILQSKIKDLTKFIVNIDSSTAVKSIVTLDSKIKAIDNEIKLLKDTNAKLEAEKNDDNNGTLEQNYEKMDFLGIQKDTIEDTKKSIQENVKNQTLSVYKDPLMAFVGFRKEFLNTIAKKMTPQEVYQKAKDILKISHPYSKNGRNAKAYLQGIKNEIEKKAENGIPIDQSEKEVYQKSVEALATIYSYEDQKYNEKSLDSLMKGTKEQNVMNMVNWFDQNREDLSAYTNQTIINHLATYYESKGEKLTVKQFNDFRNKFNSLLGSKDKQELTKYLEEIMPDYVNKAQFNDIIMDMLDIWGRIAKKDTLQKAKESKAGTQTLSSAKIVGGIVQQKVLQLNDTLEVINGESYLKVSFSEGKNKVNTTYYIKLEPLALTDMQKDRLSYLREWQNDKGEAYNKFKNAFITRLEQNIPFDVNEFDEYVKEAGLESAMKEMYSLLIAFNFILNESKKNEVEAYTKNTDGTLTKTTKKFSNFRSIYSGLVNFNNKKVDDVYNEGQMKTKLLEFFIQPLLYKYDLLGGVGTKPKVQWGNIYSYFKINEMKGSKLEEIKAFINSKVTNPSNIDSNAPNSLVEPQTTEKAIVTPLNTAQGVTAMFQGIGLGAQINGLEQIIKDLKNNNGVKSYTSSNKAKYDTILALNLKAFSDYFPNEIPNIVETQNGNNFTFELSYSPEQIKVLEDVHNTLIQSNTNQTIPQNASNTPSQPQGGTKSVKTTKSKGKKKIKPLSSVYEDWKTKKIEYSKLLETVNNLTEIPKDPEDLNAYIAVMLIAKTTGKQLENNLQDDLISRNAILEVATVLFKSNLLTLSEIHLLYSLDTISNTTNLEDMSQLKDWIDILETENNIDSAILDKISFPSEVELNKTINSLRDLINQTDIPELKNNLIEKYDAIKAKIDIYNKHGLFLDIKLTSIDKVEIVEDNSFKLETGLGLLSKKFSSRKDILTFLSTSNVDVLQGDGIRDLEELRYFVVEFQKAFIKNRENDPETIVHSNDLRSKYFELLGKFKSKNPHLFVDVVVNYEGTEETLSLLIPDESVYEEIKEELKDTTLVYTTANPYNQIFGNEEVSQSINQQIKLRYYYKNIELGTRSYYLTAMSKRYKPDDYKLSNPEFKKEFNSLVSLFRMNNRLYLEKNVEKQLQFLTKLKDKIADVMSLDLTEEDIVELRDLIFNTFDEDLLTEKASDYYYLLKDALENLDKTINTPSNVRLLFDETETENVPIKHAGLIELKQMFGEDVVTDALYNNETGEISIIADRPNEGKLLHEALHHVFKTKNMFSALEEVTTLTQEKIGKVVDNLQKLYLDEITIEEFLNVLDGAKEVHRQAIRDNISKEQIKLWIEDLSYAIKSDTEIFANFYSDTIHLAAFMSIIKADTNNETTDTIFDRYLNQVLRVTDSEQLKGTLAKLYNDKVNEQFRNFGSKIVTAPPPEERLDFDSEDLRDTFYEGSKLSETTKELSKISSKTKGKSLVDFSANVIEGSKFTGRSEQTYPEIIDLNESSLYENVFVNTYDDEELSLDSYTMTKFLDDFMLVLGDNFTNSTAYEYFHDIPLDSFMKLVEEPNEDLKEQDLQKYQAQKRIANYFNYLLEVSYDDRPNEDKTVFDNDNDKRRRRIIDLFNKLSSPNKHSIFEIAVTTEITGEEVYSIRFMGNKSRTMDGKLVTQFRPPMMITERAFLNKFIELFNNFGVVKIGTREKLLVDDIKVSFLISALGKSVGESKDGMFAQPLNKIETKDGEKKLTPQFRSQALAITKQLWSEDYNNIFLNKFGDKNHFPAFSIKFNKDTKQELTKDDFGNLIPAERQTTSMDYLYNNVILPLYKAYREMGIVDIVTKTGISVEEASKAFFTDTELIVTSKSGKTFLNQSVVTSLVVRALAEEFKLKNPVSSFQLVDGKAKINTMLKGRNMIDLMKRATPVLEHRKSHITNDMVLGDVQQNIKPLKSTLKVDESFTNNYEIVSEQYKGTELIWNGKELFFQVAFFSSKQVPPELRKYFFNKYGQFAFDGASFVVRDHFDSDYAKLMGVPNEGSAKNVILSHNAFIKHAVHAIHKSDPIGKWMIENHISMLIFDESEKNKVLLKEGETLLRDSLTGEIPRDMEGNPLGTDLGFRVNEISDDFLSGSSKLRPATHFLSFNDIGRIGEKYSNKIYAKSLQQLFNSSGMTFVNKALHIGTKEDTKNFLAIVNEYSKTFADDVNKLFRNIDKDGNPIDPDSVEFNKELASLFVKHLVNVAKNSTGDLTKAFGKIFNEIVIAYNKKDENGIRVYSDAQLFDYMKSYMVFPLVAEVARDFMNSKMQSAVKMEDKGKQLVITPDMGNMSPKRLSDALKSNIEFLEYQSDLNFSFKLFINEVYFEYKRKGTIPSNAIIFSEAKKRYAKFKADVKADKDVAGKEQYKADMIAIAKKAQENLNKAIDENGFIKRDYCFITKDTAVKLGIYVGDKVIGTIIPSAGLMEGKGLTVAGIIDNDTMSPGTMVINREYAQGIGRDYDIDVVNLTVRNRQKLTLPKWNEMVDRLAQIEKNYVKETYAVFEKYLSPELKNQIIQEINEKFEDEEYYDKLSELDKKMLVAFDNRLFTEFQKKFLGENKTGKPYYSVAENWNFELADKYHKDVGYVIVMRTIHQYLSSIGLSFDIKLKINSGKGSIHTFKVDFTEEDNWFENHISHMILTQHQVDYPKNTSKDEYDFSGEAIVTRMLGITVPYQQLTESAQERIRQVYKVFQSIITALRIPDYTQSIDFITQEVNTKYIDSMNKLAAYQTLKQDLFNAISQIDQVANVRLNDENEKLNPYNTFAGELDYSNLKDVQNVFMNFDPAVLHNYTKAIEYKILMDFISDTSNGTGYYLMNETSRDLFERNIKGISQYLFTIKSYGNNNLEFGFNEKFYMDMRLRGRADLTLIAPEEGKSKTKDRTNNSFRFISPSVLNNDNSNIDKIRIFDFTVQNVNQPEGHLAKLSREEIKTKNYEYYTHSMIMEGLIEHLGGSVNHTKHGLLRTKFNEWQQNELEPYFIANEGIPADFKKMNSATKEQWIRAFLLEHYGVSQNVWNTIKKQKVQQNTIIPYSVYKKIESNLDYYVNKANDRKVTEAKGSFKFYDATSSHLYFLREVTGIYENNTYPPQIQYYLFEETISQSDLIVPSILTGIMKNVMGTFSGDNEEYKAAAEGFIENKEKFRNVITVIAFSQLIVVGKRDHLVVEMGDDVMVNLQNVFSETLAKLKLDYIIDEQYSKIAFHMLSNPAIKWRKSVKNITLKVKMDDKDYILNISHKGKYGESAGHNDFKLIQDGKLIEELVNEMPVKSKIYSILNNSDTWSNESNRKEIITAFDLFDEENYDLEDRLKLFSQLMNTLLINMNLGYTNENGVFVLTEEGQIVVDTAFKWMTGFAENTGTLSNSMYIPGVVIDNRVLLNLMSEWSKKTLSEYKHKFMKMSDGLTDESEQSRVFEEIQYKDIEVDLKSKPKRITEHEKMQERRLGAYRTTYEGSRYSGIKRLDKDLVKSKETVINLAKDVDVLRTSHILGLGDYIKNITSVLENNEDIEALVDKNELENLVKIRIESFDEKVPIQQAVMQQIYTDLQVMKHDYTTIKTFNPEGIRYLMDFSLEESRMDFDIFSNPLRFNRRIAFRTINFDKFNFEATEELENLKFRMNHPMLTENEKEVLSTSDQRARLEEIKKEAKEAYKRAKNKEDEQAEHQFYFIDPTEAYIRSRGTLPFNREYTGLRPFSLMDLNFAKMSALSGQLANSSKELQDVINAISSLKDISFFNGITVHDQQKFEAEVYKQAERLGDDNKFDIRFNKTTGLFVIFYEDNQFKQTDQTDFNWLINFAQYYAKQNSITKEQLLAIYGAIHLRKLFDIDLKLYLQRTFFYFNTMQKEFGNDPLFAPEINRLREKYQRFVNNFTKFSSGNSEYEEQKITPKIYSSSIVRGQFAVQRFLGRYNYLQRKLENEKTSPEEIEEIEKLFALPYEELEQKIMLQLQEEIDDRTSSSVFYVPLFSNIADNRLPNHIPSLEMIKEHIIQSMFTMIESDIATCYYYQSKAYGIRNATPANEMRVLDRWFEGISNPLYLKNRVIEVTKLKKDDYVVFYTHKLDNEGEQYSALNSGKVSSIDGSSITLVNHNGDSTIFPLSDIFVIDTETSRIIQDSVYIQRNDRWAKEIENKVSDGTATTTEKMLYYSLNGFSELFVSSQMLWWSVIRTRIVQKFGGQIENYSTGDMTMKEFFDELSSSTKAKKAKAKGNDKSNNEDLRRYSKALLAASTYGGNQALDISMSETSQMGKDILVLSTSYRGSMELLKQMRMNTVEYKEYLKLAEETEKRIRKINTQIAQGVYKTKDSEKNDERPSISDARKEIRNLLLYLEIAKNKLDEDLYNLEEVDEEYANIFQNALKEVTDIKQMYGFTNKEVSKMIKSMFWKHFKSLGFNYVREPEIDLRNASFEIGFSMAKDNGSTFEQALANGYKYTTITQVIYEKYAKKIGTDDVYHRAQQLLGNYTHQKMMWFKYRLSENQYQKLAWQLKSMFGYDQFVLDTDGNITLGKSSSNKKGGAYKTKSGKNVQVKLGASSFSSMIKMIRVSTFLTYLSNHFNGVNSLTSPFMTPFFFLLQALLNLFDPDDETTLSDFLWVFNLFLGLRYGVGISVVSTLFIIPTLYGLATEGTYWEGIQKAVGKTLTTRVVTVPRDMLLGLRRLMGGEPIEASNYFVGAITGFKFRRPEQFPYSSSGLMIVDMAIGSAIPMGNEIIQLLWNLEEYDREAYRNKKENANQRRKDYEEGKKDPLRTPLKELFD